MKARHEFQHGPYSTPKIKSGGMMECLLRGKCQYQYVTSSPLAWPMARRPGKGQRRPFIVVTPELVRMMNSEATVTICHMLGITGQTVTKWRNLLGLPKGGNVGTSELRRKYTELPRFKESLKLAQSKAKDPERNEKIRQAKLGKPRPQYVIDGMRARLLGKPLSDETRRKMREAWVRRRERMK